MTAYMAIGDSLDLVKKLRDESIDLVLTSPPFLALRSYLPSDHPDKGLEVGGEDSPATYIDTLLAHTAEWARVLAPHGSIAVELGDTYSGSGGAGGDYNKGGFRDGQNRFRGSASKKGTWPLPKSLCMVPEAYRMALAYGYNPLNGEPSPAGRWRVRNVVRWVRPNPPVGALADKFRPATSTMVIACKSRTRYFDLDAVRTPHKSDPAKFTGNGYTKGHPEGVKGKESMPGNPRGAPPLDWWKITARGYKGAHYATWPPEMCETPIKAMVPERVCTTCGVPQSAPGCGHETWRAGVVLDPFVGSGTTLVVAQQEGRDSVGFDLDKRNLALAIERVPGLLAYDIDGFWRWA